MLSTGTQEQECAGFKSQLGEDVAVWRVHVLPVGALVQSMFIGQFLHSEPLTKAPGNNPEAEKTFQTFNCKARNSVLAIIRICGADASSNAKSMARIVAFDNTSLKNCVLEPKGSLPLKTTMAYRFDKALAELVCVCLFVYCIHGDILKTSNQQF